MGRIARFVEQTPLVVSAICGLGGGVLMLLYEMIAIGAAGGGFWKPLNMIAATVTNEREDLAEFRFGAALVGLLIHLITSAFWGTRYGYVFSYMPGGLRRRLGAFIVGTGFGALVWLLMGVIIGPSLNPLLRFAHPGHFFIGHLVFGLMTALLLHEWAHRAPEAGGTIPP